MSEKANDLLNKFGSAQFDFMIWNTPDNLVARDKARQEISDYIAEFEAEVTKCHELQDSYCDRIAELERDKKALRGIEENLREHIDIGTLQLSVATARIAELKAYIDQLIEIGSWAITGMTITTSYSPGVLQDLAEKKSDDWYALIKNLEECDKENEREE